MAVTYRRDRDRGARGRRRAASPDSPGGRARVDVTRDGALRRIAAAVSGRTELASLFDDVIDYTVSLFSVERAALWLLDDTVHPFRLAAHRGLSPAIREAVARLTMDSPGSGIDVVRDRKLRVLQDAGGTAVPPELRAAYAQDGIQTVCYVPIVFRDRMLGLLVLYHEKRREWPAEELELAAAFGDQMASAIENARLYEATVDLAARLRAIQDLTARLNRIQDVRGIAEAIVTEARSLIDYDNIRVYRVDHDAGMCEPIAFQGVFMGVDTPTAEMLRCRVGEGLTGWVAEHNESIVIGDAENDDRGILVGPTDGPESMLLVPMTYDDRVEGVIVARQARPEPVLGRPRGDPVDLRRARRPGVRQRRQCRARPTPAARARASARQPAPAPRGQRDAPLDARPARRPRDDRRLAQGGRRLRRADDLPGRPRGVGPASGRRPRPVRRRDHGLRRTARRRDHRLGHRPQRGGPVEQRPPRFALDPDPGHAVRTRVDDRRPAGRQR